MMDLPPPMVPLQFPQSMAALLLILLTKPFSLFKLLILFSLKTMFLAVHTWVDLIVATINFHLNMFRKMVIGFIALLLFPVRVLTALSRERMLEEHLIEVEIELDNLIWERKELEGQLQVAIKERRILESMLAEVEEENDRAIAKIEMLEVKLQDLKAKNLQLKGTVGKRWSVKDHEERDNDQNIISDSCGISYGVQSWESGYKRSGILIQDLTMNKDTWERHGKSKAESLSFLETESTSSGPMHPFTAGIFLRNYGSNEGLEQRREVALFQSLFSAVLSLLVGAIIWEAEDPCMPLVVALFTVVGMSLKSVVQFLSTIKNKPASDAVALLSINWFILGTLTYPTLPRIARMLAPWPLGFLYLTRNWLGIPSC